MTFSAVFTFFLRLLVPCTCVVTLFLRLYSGFLRFIHIPTSQESLDADDISLVGVILLRVPLPRGPGLPRLAAQPNRSNTVKKESPNVRAVQA